MVVGLGLVMVMMAALSLSGISGLVSYRDVVNDLDAKLYHTPRVDQIVRKVGQLSIAIALDTQGSQRAVNQQQHEISTAIEELQEEIGDSELKLDQMPAAPELKGTRQVSERILSSLSSGLLDLERRNNQLNTTQDYDATIAEMIRIVNQLQERALGLPDPQSGLKETLRHARTVYKSRFWVLCIATGIATLTFIGLIRCGQIWVIAPMRRLYQGASRVAQGDFDFRVDVPSNDEMAELAKSFNKMTARFQEVAGNLDRQVQERSKQLVRSERLAGVGFLAAGVAHEINNPLSAISMATESLLGRVGDLRNGASFEEFDVLEQYLEMIQRESDRCRTITAKLLDFSRGQASSRSRCDVTTIIAEVLSLIGHMSKYRDRSIEFERSSPCPVEVNGPEIKQVVLNIVANGLDSLESGGKLAISIEERTDEVVLMFCDNGCGMSQDVIDNLFEPFFTKKQTGQGTGLGLSISHRIVNDHGGTIEVASDGPGLGSTFQVHLPRTAMIRDAA